MTAMYPGRCGYSSQTGGIMWNLRESLTHDKIRAYHAATYRPENLCVIMTGMLDHEQVLNTMTKYEAKILAKRASEPADKFVRPWQEPVPPFDETVEKEIEFPCDEDDNGIVLVGWRGPSCTKEFTQSIALTLLTDYLNDTAVAPLQQHFVETEDPYCSSVSYSFIENSESCGYFCFDSVSNEKMGQVKDKLFQVLSDIASGKEPLDMERMRSVIHRKKMQLLNSLESTPHFASAFAIIGEFLYGNGNEDLDMRVQTIPFIDKCQAEPADFWISLLKKYFLDRPYVHIQGHPSPELMERMANEEKERIAEQQKKLGPNGLEEKGKILQSAKDRNDIPAPADMLSNIPIPSTENIYFHQINRLTNDPEKCSPLLQTVPYRMQVDDLKTNFVTFRVLRKILN